MKKPTTAPPAPKPTPGVSAPKSSPFPEPKETGTLPGTRVEWEIKNSTGLGFTKKSAESGYEKMKELINAEVERHFRPEFLNRLDELVVGFNGHVVAFECGL